MKIRNTFYYEATAGSGGGMSLADLTDPGVTGGLQSGDGTKKLEDLTTAQDQQQQQAPPPAVEGVNPDGTIQDGYQKNVDGTVSKVPDKPTLQEGENEDGSLQEGYIKGTDGKVTIDPAYEKVEEPDFFEAVEKLTGVKVELEYPEGVFPDSPEGVALREQKLLEMGAQGFEQTIQKADPRAYAYFLHRMHGKPDEDFFGGTNRGYTLPPKETLAESADAQSAVYKYDLMSKGLDEDAADALVAKAIKDNKLQEKADASYGTIEAAQVKQLADLQAQTKQLEEEEKTVKNNYNAMIDKTISNELGFVVPENGKAAFKQFVIDNVRYQDGKVFIVQEMGTENLKLQLEALYFQHKKGDLSAIIKKTAETKTTQRLSLRHKASAGAPNGGQDLGSSGKAGLTLGQLIS